MPVCVFAWLTVVAAAATVQPIRHRAAAGSSEMTVDVVQGSLPRFVAPQSCRPVDDWYGPAAINDNDGEPAVFQSPVASALAETIDNHRSLPRDGSASAPTHDSARQRCVRLARLRL